MAIVTCEHHSGMGLCDYCQREADRGYEQDRARNRDALRDGASTLRRAADILQSAGEYGLAEQIRSKIPR